jgi:hypothetical protein
MKQFKNAGTVPHCSGFDHIWDVFKGFPKEAQVVAVLEPMRPDQLSSGATDFRIRINNADGKVLVLRLTT